VSNGAQAQTYADHFIAVHLKEIGGGKTNSQLSAESLAQPKNTALAEQVHTLFRPRSVKWASGQRCRWYAMTSRELPTATSARCLPRRRAIRW
jgi:hypothetical protein